MRPDVDPNVNGDDFKDRFTLLIDIEISYIGINLYRRGFGETRTYRRLDDETMVKLSKNLRVKSVFCQVLDILGASVASITDMDFLVGWMIQNLDRIDRIVGYNIHFDLYVLNYVLVKKRTPQATIDHLNERVEQICLMTPQIARYKRAYSLEQYYNLLFNTQQPTTHDPEVDVRLTHTIYRYLLCKDPDMISHRALSFHD